MVFVNQKEVIEYFASKPLLDAAFAYYMSHNTALCNPYHNANHMMAMSYIAMNHVNAEYLRNFGMNADRLDVLLLCIIFHDFNHSHGLFSDAINVENAIEGMRGFVREWNSRHSKMEDDGQTGLFGRIRKAISNKEPKREADYITDEQFDRLADVIRATQYPYICTADELNNATCRAIRDLDIVVAFASDYFTQCLCGLKSEMGFGDICDAVKKHHDFIRERIEEISTQSLKELCMTEIKDFDAYCETISNIYPF